MKNRDTIRYYLQDGNEKTYIGITDDLERRTAEHRNDGLKFTSVHKVGPIVSRDTANEWEERSIDTYKRGHGGKRPRDNRNDSGK